MAQEARADLHVGGNWLVRQDGLVLGPIPGGKVVEKLFAGEIDARTEVQQVGGGDFRRLSEEDAFRVHLAKAQAKQRVDRQAQSQAEVEAKRRNVRIGIIALVALLLVAVAGSAARYLAVHKPWKDADELAYADYISVELPTISRARHATEELLEYPGAGPGKKRPTAPGSAPDRPTQDPRNVAGPAKPPATRPPPAGKPRNEDPDGMQMGEVDQDAINAVVASHQKSLFPCLMPVAQAKPNVATRIPIEFVVGADGKVTKVWIDNPEYKEGALQECMMKELQKWPFKPGQASATVNLAFTVGGKKK